MCILGNVETSPVNVIPAMLPTNQTNAAPQTGRYANLAVPESLHQEINPHQYYQGCLYPPFVQHENQLYPTLHVNYCSLPPQENAPPAQHIQLKDPIHSLHLMPSFNNFSFPH